jgi:hypothetical protein
MVAGATAKLVAPACLPRRSNRDLCGARSNLGGGAVRNIRVLVADHSIHDLAADRSSRGCGADHSIPGLGCLDRNNLG